MKFEARHAVGETREARSPAVEGMVSREEQLVADAERKIMSALRSGARVSRNMLAAAALLRVFSLASDAGWHPDAREAAEPFGAELDRQMFSPEAAAFLREHHGDVSLEYLNDQGRGGTHSYTGESFEDARALDFTDRSMPRRLDASWYLSECAPDAKIAENAVDEHGNRIRVLRVRIGDTTKIIADAEIPPAFSSGPDESAYSLTVDFSKFGGPKLENIAEGRRIPRIAQIGENGEYPVFARAKDAGRFSVLLDPHKQAIGEELRRAEAVHGAKPGELVNQGVWITGADYANAFAVSNKSGEGSFVMLHDEMLRPEGGFGKDRVTNTGVGIRSVIDHEASHVADHRFGYSRRMQGAHRAFPREFLSGISEESFLPGTWGGHPWDNERELFATTMTDLLNPGFEEGVKNLDSGKRRQLADLVTITRETATGEFRGFLDGKLKVLEGRFGTPEPPVAEATARHAKDWETLEAERVAAIADDAAFREAIRNMTTGDLQNLYVFLNDESDRQMEGGGVLAGKTDVKTLKVRAEYLHAKYPSVRIQAD